MQKAIVVYYISEKKNNLDELNNMLENGWKVINQSPMGGECGTAMYSLVILSILPE
ncbi:hypothetical protein [Paenibacillus sp. OV219]|uniref:hypothetical protein n=1 Tax=Paenibacillus sp. OV219 TaxID=1884377 RepID=UPI0008B6CAB6|nr:hypothetical protein [Paenibacillus sp. OV219]SEN95536.1 hypothetical protein SAMN05518847_10555 [Paenibacillus sp. OV219]